MSISAWAAQDTSWYYTYMRAARFLGMPFDAARDALNAHAEHSGGMWHYSNIVPSELVESLPTCEHCRKAREAA